MSEPFDLAKVKANAAQADGAFIADVAGCELGEREADYLDTVLPTRLLALHAALVRYRQELVTRSGRKEIHMPHYDTPEIQMQVAVVRASEQAAAEALAAFDQAVTL